MGLGGSESGQPHGIYIQKQKIVARFKKSNKLKFAKCHVVMDELHTHLLDNVCCVVGARMVCLDVRIVSDLTSELHFKHDLEQIKP